MNISLKRKLNILAIQKTPTIDQKENNKGKQKEQKKLKKVNKQKFDSNSVTY